MAVSRFLSSGRCVARILPGRPPPSTTSASAAVHGAASLSKTARVFLLFTASTRRAAALGRARARATRFGSAAPAAPPRPALSCPALSCPAPVLPCGEKPVGGGRAMRLGSPLDGDVLPEAAGQPARDPGPRPQRGLTSGCPPSPSARACRTTWSTPSWRPPSVSTTASGGAMARGATFQGFAPVAPGASPPLRHEGAAARRRRRDGRRAVRELGVPGVARAARGGPRGRPGAARRAGSGGQGAAGRRRRPLGRGREGGELVWRWGTDR